jgi:hypothetical protein
MQGWMRRIALGFLVALAACGDSKEDSLVGGSCHNNGDCRILCEADPVDFPGGFCTLHCTSDSNCPHGTVCMANAGGICMFPCGSALDCTFLGTPWTCKSKDRISGGENTVCIGN